MTASYGINITIVVQGEDEQACDREAFFYKDVIRTKLHNTLNKSGIQMYKTLLKYEVELPNRQSE